MPTVVDEPASVGTLPQGDLGPRTLHVIQKNGARAWAKVGLSQGGHSIPAAQLLAHDLCFLLVPQIVAHCAPHTFKIHLHSARTPARTFHELHGKPVFGRKVDHPNLSVGEQSLPHQLPGSPARVPSAWLNPLQWFSVFLMP